MLNNFVLYLIYKADNNTLRTGTGRSSRSVKISLVILWRIEMQYTLNVIYMNTSSSNICGNQSLNLAISECG